MFAKKTQSIIKCLGAEDDLIYNENLNERIELLSLVKITKTRLKKTIKYTFMDLTLVDLLEDATAGGIDPEALVNRDIEVLRDVSTFTRKNAGNPSSADSKKKNPTTEKNSSTAFTVKKDMVDLRKLRETCNNRKMNRTFNEIITKKTETLAFVYQVFYNHTTVTLQKKARVRSQLKALILEAKKWGKERTEFTVPVNTTFAFGLMEVTAESNKIEIPIRKTNIKRISRNPKPLTR
ncbi:uncharacterized protein LOC110368487 [Fundulus heteroclitus]|uniref:uncharacterized protein LOC110368487 n=1 Tax=Fundulus heteroclitus TaxID=8078 RepID=UPI00165CB9A1|nr:uncharacterized protein LOC110368487 [Fundulus heteroclitus]XP_035995800.1 uncharacterized protein LOC110368487 [Fundulus heteroclitus]